MTTLAHLLDLSDQNFPDKCVVFHGGQAYDYRQLAYLSGKLAHQLHKMGVGRGDCVGFVMPKSFAAIVAIFGVLGVGAAYVPIPETTPPKRIKHIANDCQMKVLLTDAAGASRLGGADLDRTALLELELDALARLEGERPLLTAEADDVAYVLYTSGSTGLPKGVMITHAASLNFIGWAKEKFEITSNDRLVNLAPLSFDLSIFDIFVAVASGASIHLISPEQAIMPAALCKYVEQHRITVWYSVPTALMNIPKYGQLEKNSLASLRHIIFAGEPFPIPKLEQLIAAIPTARFHNLYGPTETNVVAHYEVEGLKNGELPIGLPCAGHEFIINDNAGKPLSGDGIGELLVSGPSLMKGYCNQPELTAAVLNRPHENTAALHYHTGDRVRRDKEGLYYFIGRNDDMLKSRGFRIEPGEIESVLSRHSQVQEVAVIGVPDPNVGHRLAAVIVSDDAIPSSDLAAYCSEFLPKYMVPTAFAHTREPLPRTANGKVDKEAALGLLDAGPA